MLHVTCHLPFCLYFILLLPLLDEMILVVQTKFLSSLCKRAAKPVVLTQNVFICEKRGLELLDCCWKEKRHVALLGW